MNTNSKATDSLLRDDLKAANAFDSLSNEVQRALKRAASRGTANLPTDMGTGWIMVPTKVYLRQVAFDGLRAWRF